MLNRSQLNIFSLNHSLWQYQTTATMAKLMKDQTVQSIVTELYLLGDALS